MSRYMGSRTAGSIPPHIPKTKAGSQTHKTNKYAKLRPSEQRNTSGQRRVQRDRERFAQGIIDGGGE